jgi:hypothetical protein
MGESVLHCTCCGDSGPTFNVVNLQCIGADDAGGVLKVCFLCSSCGKGEAFRFRQPQSLGKGAIESCGHTVGGCASLSQLLT